MTLYYLLLILTRFHADPRLGPALFRVAFLIVTPVKIVGFFTIVAALVARRPADASPLLKNPLALCFFSFASLQIFEVLVFKLPIPSASVSSLVSIGLMLVATRALVSNEDRLRKTVRVMIVTSAIASMWIYRQYFILHVFPANGIEQDTNYESLTLVTGIPLAVWMVQYETGVWWRRIAVLCVGLMGGGVLLTQSRAGLIAAVVMGLAAIVFSRRKMLTLGLVVLAIAAGVELSPAGLATRFRSIRLEGAATNGAEESTRIHIELAKAGLAMIEAYPLTGIGLEQFEDAAPNYNPALLEVAGHEYIAHDTYIQIGAEGGIPVLLLFLSLMAVAVFNCREVRRHAGAAQARMATAMQVGLIGFSIAAASVTAEYVTTFWIVVFLSQNLREIGWALPARKIRRRDAISEPLNGAGGEESRATGNGWRVPAFEVDASGPVQSADNEFSRSVNRISRASR